MDDKLDQLAHRIVTIGDFDWKHDGDNKSGDLKFIDDGSIQSRFGDGDGWW